MPISKFIYQFLNIYKARARLECKIMDRFLMRKEDAWNSRNRRFSKYSGPLVNVINRCIEGTQVIKHRQ